MRAALLSILESKLMGAAGSILWSNLFNATI
jgi:hypothetical protein